MKIKFYVYALKREDGTPFYIGKGCRSRLSFHLWAAKRGWKGHRYNIIRKILASGGKVVHEKLYDDLTNAEAIAIEKKLIAEYDGLVNQTEGGDGAPGYKHTEDSLKNLRENWHKRHKPLTPEQRKKIADKNRGRKHSAESKAKLSASISGPNHWNYGKKITKTHFEKMMAAHVTPVIICGKEFPSMASAGKEFGVNRNTVLYRCTRGKNFPDWRLANG